MDTLRIVNIIILLVCLAGGIYYTIVDDHLQGAVVVLLGILYFLGMPHIIRDE